jgi:hypothetical protein
MAKILVGVKKYRIWLWPHVADGRFYFGRVLFLPKKEITTRQEIYILLAPRILGLVALILFPLIFLYVPTIVTLFLFGGMLDWLYGFLGGSTKSDVDRTADLMKIDVGWLRFFGFFLFFLSITIFFLRVY